MLFKQYCNCLQWSCEFGITKTKRIVMHCVLSIVSDYNFHKLVQLPWFPFLDIDSKSSKLFKYKWHIHLLNSQKFKNRVIYYLLYVWTITWWYDFFFCPPVEFQLTFFSFVEKRNICFLHHSMKIFQNLTLVYLVNAIYFIVHLEK